MVPNLVWFEKTGAQRFQNHMKIFPKHGLHEQYLQKKWLKIVRASLGKFGQKSFASPNICQLPLLWTRAWLFLLHAAVATLKMVRDAIVSALRRLTDYGAIMAIWLFEAFCTKLSQNYCFFLSASVLFLSTKTFAQTPVIELVQMAKYTRQHRTLTHPRFIQKNYVNGELLSLEICFVSSFNLKRREGTRPLNSYFTLHREHVHPTNPYLHTVFSVWSSRVDLVEFHWQFSPRYLARFHISFFVTKCSRWIIGWVNNISTLIFLNISRRYSFKLAAQSVHTPTQFSPSLFLTSNIFDPVGAYVLQSSCNIEVLPSNLHFPYKVRNKELRN